jgi:hypothetical protein
MIEPVAEEMVIGEEMERGRRGKRMGNADGGD